MEEEKDQKEESKPITLNEYRRKFLEKQRSEKIQANSSETANHQEASSDHISLYEYKRKLLKAERSRRIQSQPLENANYQETPSDHISLYEYKRKFLKAERSRGIQSQPLENANYQETLSDHISLNEYERNFLEEERSKRVKPKVLVVNEGLSDSDKKRLYHEIIDYLSDKKQRGYTADEIYNIIYKHYNNILIKSTKTKEKYERLLIILLALYKAKTQLDLDTQLISVLPLKNLSEIKKLTDEIKIELNLFTGEDLYKNLEIIPTDKKNDELFNENDNIISKEARTFVNNKIDNKELQGEHDDSSQSLLNNNIHNNKQIRDHSSPSDIVESLSYVEIAKISIDKGFEFFSPSARKIYKKKILQFLVFYKKNYNNFFSKDFDRIKGIQIILTKKEFLKEIQILRNKMLQSDYPYKDNGVFILYIIINKQSRNVRIGFTGDFAYIRLSNYIRKGFSNDVKKITNLHLDIRKIGDVNEFNEKFEFVILSVSNNLAQIKTLERLITIYENRSDNELGYDLSNNDYYNKVIGNLFDYIHGDLKDIPLWNWKEIQPERLKKAIKKCITWQEILKFFPIIKKKDTIKRRALLYGFSLNGIGGLKDLRAFFMKPTLIEASLKRLSVSQTVDFLIERGFSFLERMSSNPTSRYQFLNKIFTFIWGRELLEIDRRKGQHLIVGVKRLLIYREALKLARNPKYNTLPKVEDELIKRGIKLNTSLVRHELPYIFIELKRSYKEEQNKILEPILTPLLMQDDPDLSCGDIRDYFGLDMTEANRLLIRNIIYRIYGEKTIGAIKSYLRMIK